MLQKLGGWFVVLALLVGGFFAGRASVRVDDPKLRDSLAVYRNDRRNADREAAVLRDSILIWRTHTDAALHDRDAALQRAGERTSAARLSGLKADSLERLIASALTHGDSLRACMLTLEQRKNECVEIRQANVELATAIEKDTVEVIPGLRKENAALLLTRQSDSANQVRADRLISKLEKNVRGCRLPLVGVPCPNAVLNYDLTDRSLSAGAGIPLKHWLTVSVTTRVYRP